MTLTTFSDLLRNSWKPWFSRLYLFEGVLIFVGNAATIAVFWRRRVALKRASYLLINLSVADLLVGAGLLAMIAASLPHSEDVVAYMVTISGLLVCLGATASICSLTIIAVERAFSVAKPLKHRAVPTPYYKRAIGIQWVVSVMATVLLGAIYSGQQHLRFIASSFCIACLLTIFLSYAVIWRSSSKRPMKHAHANDQAQNRKLAKTLVIVTFLSLSTWLPVQVFLPFPAADVFGTRWELFLALLCLEYSNSLLNPFVYVLRMPGYRQELKRIFLRKLCQDRQEVIA